MIAYDHPDPGDVTLTQKNMCSCEGPQCLAEAAACQRCAGVRSSREGQHMFSFRHQAVRRSIKRADEIESWSRVS